MMVERYCRKCFHSKACKEVASHSGYSDMGYTESQCKHFTPIADVVEVVQGTWIEVYRNKTAIVYECSCCGYLTLGTSDYCVCGAKMEERNLA